MAFPMLSTSMLRILRWLDDHPASLESAWDVPRSLSLEGIADGIGVVRSALFQPMSVLEEEGLIMTRQAHVIGADRRKRKVVHITEQGRQAVHETGEDVAPRPSRQSSNLKGQIPENTVLHGRTEELKLLHEAINLKQTAILVAHHLADDKSIPSNLLELDTKFASQLFDIQSAKRMIKEAQKDKDELTEDVYWDRLDVANRLADDCKSNIQQIFNDTFGA